MSLLYIEDIRHSLDYLLKNDIAVYIIGEDIVDPYGGAFKVTKGLSTKYPERLISTPMSEQGFTGLGIGLSLNGLKPIVEIMFGDFITLTADQIINHIAKFHEMYGNSTHFVLRTPSGGYRGYGATHSQSLEKIYLGIPGVKVVSPSVINHPGRLLEKSINLGMPVLFVENKLDYSRKLIDEGIYQEIIEIETIADSNFPMKTARIIDEKPEITIITYGGMVQNILDIMENIFMEEEIAIELLSISDISHIDFNRLAESISSKKIIVVEESHVEFGWGSHIVSNLVKIGDYNYLNNIGSKLSYIPAAKGLEDNILIQQSDIIEEILNTMINQ